MRLNSFSEKDYSVLNGLHVVIVNQQRNRKVNTTIDEQSRSTLG